MYEYTFEGKVEKNLKSIVQYLESIDNQLTLDCVNKGAFSKGDETFRKLLSNFLNEIKNLTAATSSTNYEKQNLDKIENLLDKISNTLTNESTNKKSSDNDNSLILKSINKLEQQNSLNVIDSAFMNANSQFVNIVTNYRQKNLKFDEAHITLQDISENLLNLIKNNYKLSIITLDQYNYYVNLQKKFKVKCDKFSNYCGLAERKENNNKNL